MTKFIYEEGNDFANTPNRYRLTLRELDAEFFQKYIQDYEGIKILKTLDPTTLSDSQKNIQANTLLLLRRVEELSEEQRTRLAQAMILQCYIVEISTSDLDSAYNVFSILNDRGLNLTHADILKAQMIGKILPSQRSRYTAKWEGAEELLKKRMFLNLFFYLDTIYRDNADVSQEPFLARFRKHVYPTANPTLTPTQFIDKVLLPHAKALNTIVNANYQCSKGAKEINNLLKWLYLPYNRVDYPQTAFPWAAAVMHFLTLHENNPDLLLRFLTDLERLEVIMNYIPYTPTTAKNRRERYSQLIGAIKLGEDLFAPESPLQITSAEKQIFLKILEGDVYHSANPLYLLLRLDNELAAADEPVYSFSTISIEHVLPQRPKANSDWRRWFPDEAVRNDYTNCLGNLVLLSKPKNSEAQNFDFTVKKRKYFVSDKGVSTFAITTQVLQEQEWTPEVINRRQEMLINKLKKIWRLE